MTTQKFQINTEPHVAEIGDDIRLEFQPEVYTDELMDAWAELRSLQTTADEAEQKSKDPAVIKERALAATAALRGFLSGMMLPESQTRFAEVKLPDRILIDVQRWILEVYGLRPTTASSDSSTPSDDPTTGLPSSGDSSVEASTPSE